jgi:hypothetical protein
MQVFDVFLIKPTHYDDEGYPIQWWRSIIPSNSLACVAALVDDAETARFSARTWRSSPTRSTRPTPQCRSMRS